MKSTFKILHTWIELTAWKKIFIALILGVICGLILGDKTEFLKPLGNIFIHAIHMTIVPVVFTVIVCAVLSMEDFAKMRRLSVQAALIYSICMVLAAVIGIFVASIIQPGVDFPLVQQTEVLDQIRTPPSLINMLENIIPKSPMAAFVEGNILQIVVFSILFGLSINLAGEKAGPVVSLFKSLSAVVFKLVGLIMSFAPYGIFAFIAWTFGNFGFNAFMPLIKFIMSVFIACVLQLTIVYSISLWLITGDNPVVFIKKILHPLTFAFTTCSSAATLPISMETVRNKWGVTKELSDFLLPLGTSFNLNGLTIYLSVATIFAANIFSVNLAFYDYITLVFTIIITTMGIAAVPGSAIVAMSVVMTSVGVPLGGLGIIVGVDRINDMLQTATNVAGDIYATVIISYIEEKK
jgi:DAACS family dicarboxylate/amino acid:cation (Na+ or H+) symporter